MSDFEDAARRVARVWDGLNGGQRRVVNEYVGNDMYRALYALCNEVDALTKAGAWGDGDAPEAGAPEPPREYPAEKRIKDLEGFLDVKHVRADALHHARKSWAAACDIGQNVTDHARSVTRLAQAFERYLTDGTVHPADEGRKPFEVPPEPVAGHGQPPLSEPTVKQLGRAVTAAALRWVGRAHLKNPGGPENWRNWSDDHDVDLINAVLAYRGLPPLERKAP